MADSFEGFRKKPKASLAVRTAPDNGSEPLERVVVDLAEAESPAASAPAARGAEPRVLFGFGAGDLGFGAGDLGFGGGGGGATGSAAFGSGGGGALRFGAGDLGLGGSAADR